MERHVIVDVCPPLSDGSAMLYLAGGTTATAPPELMARCVPKPGDVVWCFGHMAYSLGESVRKPNER